MAMEQTDLVSAEEDPDFGLVRGTNDRLEPSCTPYYVMIYRVPSSESHLRRELQLNYGETLTIVQNWGPSIRTLKRVMDDLGPSESYDRSESLLSSARASSKVLCQHPGNSGINSVRSLASEGSSACFV
jgi:hypothetical protein